jgi:hypothetical protein
LSFFYIFENVKTKFYLMMKKITRLFKFLLPVTLGLSIAFTAVSQSKSEVKKRPTGEKNIGNTQRVLGANSITNYKTDAMVTDTLRPNSIATCSLTLITAAGGFVTGTNDYNDMEKAQKYNFTGTGDISEVIVNIGDAQDFTGGSFKAKIYSVGSDGNPDQVLGTSEEVFTLDMDVDFLTSFVFTNPVTVTGPFFASVEVNNGGDVIGIVSTVNGCAESTNLSYEMWESGEWYTISAGWNGVRLDMYILPVISYEVPDNDVGTDVILTPVASNCNLPSNAQVSARFKNFGAETISGFEVSYSVNGGTPVTENVGSVNSLATINHTFATPVNLSASGSYTIVVYTTLSGDGNADNDTLKITLNSGSLVVPHTDDFENGIARWVISDENEDGSTWSLGSSGTQANSGTGFIKYSYNANNTADDWIFSPCFYLASGSDYTLKFNFRARSATYPEAFKVAIGTGANSSAMIEDLADYNFVDGTTYELSETVFTVPSTGYYNIGFYAYSDADMWEIFIDDFAIEGTTVSAKNEKIVSKLSVYPNPAKDIININAGSDKIANITLLNTIGQEVFSTSASISSIDTSLFNEGAYTLKITTDKEVVTKLVHISK